MGSNSSTPSVPRRLPAGHLGGRIISLGMRGVILAVLSLSLFAPAVARAHSDQGNLVEDGALRTTLDGFLSELDALYGVVAIDLEDSQSVSINADSHFPTASMYKLLVMYRVFEAIDAGYLSTDDALTIRASDVEWIDPEEGDFWIGDTLSVGQALEAMITWSSNSAAHALARAVGGWNHVAAAADELGMSDTFLDDDFWTTPGDMAHFFRLLADRSLVSPEASDQMMELLLAQQVKDRLPALLPEEVQVAHKTGDLEDVRNDGGIVWGPGGSYILVMMSQGGDPYEEVEAEATISRLTFEHFGQ